MSTRVLVLCPDPVGERMSGMGIRYTEIARALARSGLEVTLAGREVVGDAPPGVRATAWAADRVGPLRALADRADAIVSPPGAPHVMRVLRRSRARVAIDLYDPETFEVLERFRDASKPVRALHATTATDRLTDALRTGQFFLCASERQRDLWLGAMLALGILSPAVYAQDPLLRALVDVVPFGVPDEAPVRGNHDPIRARFPEIGPDARLLLWNGGLWRWLDAPTAIRALARIRAKGVEARLVFMGASRAGGAGEALEEALAVVAAEGLPATAVLFNDAWVDYGERAAWLQHADAAVSTHTDNLETRFAFRTRLLDCFWAGLPPVVSGGDALAGEISARGLGAVAAPGDVDGIAAGMEEVLSRGRDAYAGELRAAAERHAWSRVVVPLQRFVSGESGLSGRSPRHSPLGVPPAVQARRVAQRLTRRVRALRN